MSDLHRSSMPLFDRPPEPKPAPAPVVPFGDPTLPDEEKPRLSPQHLKIAAMLREGPATNLELGKIAQRFGARLWELKRAGFLWKRSTIEPGVYRYEMVRDFPPDASL